MRCQGPIKQGRADRKFCSEGCKNEYHNNQKAESRNEIIRIEKALKNNRRILKKVLGVKHEEIVTRETLLKMGFEFTYHTHHVLSSYQKNEYTFCYNYGYRKIDEERLKVVKSFK
ncbi:hypothetical protein A4D02_28455 [Niastella koreensis]|uniref:DUF2116 family Zn-ribbon domain-containing protein n=1 Tax=Niastella koreensis TaxID=354356 RepID=A0ABX3NYE5_9BACT|nr:hypothetical protein A4D02_28455 [Niastella koreensis]